MEERINNRICGRGNDLIAFLYREVNDRQARDFELHLTTCGECEREYRAFRGVRDGVVAWRQQSLGALPSQESSSVYAALEKRSALVAIRQFLKLSPVWLKGAVAFASVVFCVATVLTVANLGQKPAPMAVGSDKVYSEKELQDRVERELQAKLAELNRLKGETPEENPTVPVMAQNAKRKLRDNLAYPAKTKRAPLTRSEREQLAADLRLISLGEDSDLDLFGEEPNR